MRPGTRAGAGPEGLVAVTWAAAAGLVGTGFGSVGVGVGEAPVGLGVKVGAGGGQQRSVYIIYTHSYI